MAIVDSVASKLFGGITNWAKIQSGLKKFDGEKYAEALAVSTIASICIKDGIGCAMYVTQSLNNKKIPEKRRKFVSALDLTNGLLMILCQIGMFFGMKKLNNKLLTSLFPKTFDKAGKALKPLTEKVRIHQKAAGITPSSKSEISDKYKELRKFCLDTIGNITNIAAATILGKRVIVPFIATPMAKKVEGWMGSKTEEEKNETKNADNSEIQDVSMQGTKETGLKDSIHSIDIVNTETGSTNLLDKYRKNN